MEPRDRRHRPGPCVPGTAVAQEFLTLLPLCAAAPKPLHRVLRHSDTGIAAPVFIYLQGLDRRSNVSPGKSSSHWRKQVLFVAPTHPVRPFYTWCPRRTAPGVPAATTATSKWSQYRTGTPAQHAVPQWTYGWLHCFYKIDLVKAYHQIPIADISKTVIPTHFGLFLSSSSWLLASKMPPRPSNASKTTFWWA